MSRVQCVACSVNNINCSGSVQSFLFTFIHVSVVVDEISDRAVTCPVRHSLLLADSLHNIRLRMELSFSEAIIFQNAYNKRYKKKPGNLLLLLMLFSVHSGDGSFGSSSLHENKWLLGSTVQQ